MFRRDYLILAAVFLGGCALYLGWSLLLTEPGYPLDDSWIHQVFARNIATGHGFSFNPDIPISGATAPLWTLLMALLWPIFGPIAGGILAGIVLEFLAIVAIYKLTFLITNRNDLAFVVGLIAALTWVLIWGALSGMEVGLYSALSLWGLYFYFRAESFDDKRNYLAYVLFALAFLARPECALFLAAAAIRDSIVWFKSDNKLLLPWVWRILPAVLLLTPYFAFNYAVTGSFLTQTFTAKVQDRGLVVNIISGNFLKVIQSLTIYPLYQIQDFLWNLCWINPFLIAAIIAGTTKFITFQDSQKSKRLMLVLMLFLYIPLMGVMAPILNSTYHRLRMIDNIIPLFIMLGVVGYFWDEAQINKRARKYLWIIASIFGAVGLLAILADDYIVRFLEPRLLQHISRVRASVPTEKLIGYVSESGKNSMFVALLVFISSLLNINWICRKIKLRPVMLTVIIVIAGYSLGTLITNGWTYANDVKNINDMDKKIGSYLNEITSENQSVAVNDIGAIGYFCKAKILDLKGLVSPEITQPMIAHDSLAFNYMLNHDRVDYVAIFPVWFDYIPRQTNILVPIKRFGVEWNSILGGDTTIVYKANWPKK